MGEIRGNEVIQRSRQANDGSGVQYTSVASGALLDVAPIQAQLVTLDMNDPHRTVSEEYSSIPEARELSWQDDFFDDDENIVAVFDFDYESMETFFAKMGWCYYGCSAIYPPIFSLLTLGLYPCFLRKNVQWSVNSQHVAITRDGIRYVRDRRPTCWGLGCTDAGKSSKTVPFDKITDCDIEEPAGNSCFIIENILSTVNIDTASSGHGNKELKISGLKDPHAFKRLVWGMKRTRDSSSSSRGLSSGPAPFAMEMVARKAEETSHDTTVAELLREIRDELRQNNELLRSVKENQYVAPTAPTAELL